MEHIYSDWLVFSCPPRVPLSLFLLSPIHAPWLLAHKIQSPQEKEALYALTVSLTGSLSSPVLKPERAGPQSYFGVVGSLRGASHWP